MNKSDTWYVQKAVELADGWEIVGECVGGDPIIAIGERPDILSWSPEYLPQWALDALAAQLVRQVDALEPSVVVTIGDRHTEVLEMHGVNRTTVRLYNRTMNTIRAIVDSKVLSECTKSDQLQTNDD